MRHLTVRGERGEWSDNLLLTLDADGKPQRERLMQILPERYSLLDTPSLHALCQKWRSELQLENSQDEFAIARANGFPAKRRLTPSRRLWTTPCSVCCLSRRWRDHGVKCILKTTHGTDVDL